MVNFQSVTSQESVQAVLRHAYSEKYLILEKITEKGTLLYRLVKGKIDPNEKPEHTVLREIREETCIPRNMLIYVNPLRPSRRYKHPLFETKIHCYYFKTRNKGNVPEDNREGIRNILWLNFRDAYNRLSYPEERDVLKDAAVRHFKEEIKLDEYQEDTDFNKDDLRTVKEHLQRMGINTNSSS